MSLWLAKTLAGGRNVGLAAMMGTNLGCCIHSLLAAFGISVLINASPVAFNTMKVIGAFTCFGWPIRRSVMAQC